MVDVQKGPFWVIADSFDDDNGVDETAILCFPVDHSTEPTPSHIDAWQKVCGEYKRKLPTRYGCVIHRSFEVELFTSLLEQTSSLNYNCCSINRFIIYWFNCKETL